MIYTNTDLNAMGQYFWEAFPAGSGPADRTTYLFTYIDADPRRCGGLFCDRHMLGLARLSLHACLMPGGALAAGPRWRRSWRSTGA